MMRKRTQNSGKGKMMTSPIGPHSTFVPSHPSFPDELSLKILSLLSFKDLIKVTLVSHTFKRLAQDEALWKKILLQSGLFARADLSVFSERPYYNAYKKWAPTSLFLKATFPTDTITGKEFLKALLNYLGEEDKLFDQCKTKKSSIINECFMHFVHSDKYAIFHLLLEKFIKSFGLIIIQKEEIINFLQFFGAPFPKQKDYLENIAAFVMDNGKYIYLTSMHQCPLIKINYGAVLRDSSINSFTVRFSVDKPEQYIFCHKKGTKLIVTTPIDISEGKLYFRDKCYSSLKEIISQMMHLDSSLIPFSNIKFYNRSLTTYPK